MNRETLEDEIIALRAAGVRPVAVLVGGVFEARVLGLPVWPCQLLHEKEFAIVLASGAERA